MTIKNENPQVKFQTEVFGCFIPSTVYSVESYFYKNKKIGGEKEKGEKKKQSYCKHTQKYKHCPRKKKQWECNMGIQH